METGAYVGRFAPTPSGPLHFGTVVAALGSFLDARAHGGCWRLRIDDVDPPRVRRGAEAEILSALQRLQLFWDGSVQRQRDNVATYAKALHRLQAMNLVYPCVCPRQLTKNRVYPGTCRERLDLPSDRHSLRLCCRAISIQFHDLVQGEYRCELEHETGDFIVRRSDGLFAYHLAAVVDDAALGVNHVVRGADLLASTPRQIYIQQLLRLAQPDFLHLPVARDRHGKKISKSDKALPVLLQAAPARILLAVLRFLGQAPDAGLGNASVSEVLDWAVRHWRRQAIPATCDGVCVDSLLRQN